MKGDFLLVSAGVCAFMYDDDNNVFFARHAEKPGRFPGESVGTSSETLRWVPLRTTGGVKHTETVHEAWIRSLREELGVDRPIFDKAGFSLEISKPLVRSYIHTMANGTRSLLATNMFVRVDNPEALMFDYQTSEEILSTGFAPLEEVVRMSPFRPGFMDWFIAAAQHKTDSGVGSESSAVEIEWIDDTSTPRTHADVSMK